MAPARVFAADLAHRWPLPPRLASANAEAFAEDIAAARPALALADLASFAWG